MSEMIERVARAMHANTEMLWSQMAWDALPGSAQDLYCSLARAAIEAMREPTFEMANAYWGQSDGYDVWRDMIDAALVPRRAGHIEGG